MIDLKVYGTSICMGAVRHNILHNEHVCQPNCLDKEGEGALHDMGVGSMYFVTCGFLVGRVYRNNGQLCTFTIDYIHTQYIHMF